MKSVHSGRYLSHAIAALIVALAEVVLQIKHSGPA